MLLSFLLLFALCFASPVVAKDEKIGDFMTVGGGWSTFIVLVNTDLRSSADVALTLFDARGGLFRDATLNNDGEYIGCYKEVKVSPGGVSVLVLNGGSELKTGWILLEGRVLGFLVRSDQGNLYSPTPFVTPSYQFEIPDAVWNLTSEEGTSEGCGLSFANPNVRVGHVLAFELHAIEENGFEAGQTTFTLAPGEQIAKVINQFFPGLPTNFRGRIVASVRSGPFVQFGAGYTSLGFRF